MRSNTWGSIAIDSAPRRSSRRSVSSVWPAKRNCTSVARDQCREPEVRTYFAANPLANLGFTSGTGIIGFSGVLLDSEVRPEVAAGACELRNRDTRAHGSQGIINPPSSANQAPDKALWP